MNKHLQHFVDSFKVGKDFAYTFAADIITFSLIFVVFSWFAAYVQQRSVTLMGGKSPEELSQILASAAPAQLLPFMSEVKTFLLTMFLGVLVLVVLSFLLFSYSRAVIWNHLENKKVTKKNYWRWNLLNLALLIPFCGFLIAFVIVKILVSVMVNLLFGLMPVFYVTHVTLMDNIHLVINGVTSFYVVLFFVVLVLLVYHSFVKKYKVWDSIMAGFSAFRQQGKKIWLLLLLATTTAGVLTLITLPIKQELLYSPLVSALVNIDITALFLAWLRLYLLRAVSHEHQ